jgi:hypothetical protein
MGPRARIAAGLAFDTTRNRYVLFGGGAGAPPAGSADTLTYLGDTWETFDPAAVSPSSQPRTVAPSWASRRRLRSGPPP